MTGEQSRKQPWNPHVQGKSQTVPVNTDLRLPTTLKTPQTAHEFSKVWRRQCTTEIEKYQLLLKIGGQELRRIFKAEISMGFLGEFLLILHNCLEENDSMNICNILAQLSKTNRFDLSLKFLGEGERNVTSKLIKRLEDITFAQKSLDSASEGNKTKSVVVFQELRSVYDVRTVNSSS